ncbi:MAG: 3-methyl-2-oxobutanoate hydroxymethyltransferase [Nitrososphaeria archaeon]|nr:3-methyl-2-oxobutanoate hydroxymethyltransferase [Nitrososphaeria archaeon]
MHKSVKDILDKKKNGQKISVITAYDYTLASLCDKAGIDIMLVGDSAGMVMLGYESTIPVTMEQMVLFTEAVSRARQNSLVFSIALEMVTSEVSKIISESVSIPTIGIGSGKYCDGQVLVVHDLLGMYDKLKPKFVKQYLSLSDQITKAVSSYKSEIESGKFPAKENWFTMEKTELDKLMKEIG